jgi:hypothetical protein
VVERDRKKPTQSLLKNLQMEDLLCAMKKTNHRNFFVQKSKQFYYNKTVVYIFLAIQTIGFVCRQNLLIIRKPEPGQDAKISEK